MKIVIAGNYGANNLGDELILEGLLEMLKLNFPQTEITVLSGNPGNTIEAFQKYNISSVPKFPSGLRSLSKNILTANKTKKAVKNCDYFILGGGGLFSNLSLKAYFIWGVQAFMAYLYRKPVIMYGQSVGPLKSKFKKWLIKKIFQKSAFIAVRDEESKNELKKIGVHKKIYIIPDLIFRIKAGKKSSTPRAKQIVVALRYLPELNPSFVQEIANFLNFLAKKQGYKIIFMDFQKGSDKIIHREVIRRLEHQQKYEEISEIKDSQRLFTLFSNSDLVLGMRLHAVLTAIKTETPFIAINYAPKVENFLKYAKLNSYLLEMDDLRLQKLYGLIKKDFSVIEKQLQIFNSKALLRHREVERELKNLVTKL